MLQMIKVWVGMILAEPRIRKDHQEHDSILSADSMSTSTITLSCVLAKWLAMKNIYAATQTTPKATDKAVVTLPSCARPPSGLPPVTRVGDS